VGSVDYQYRKSFVGFTKNPFLNYRITVSDSKPRPVTHSNPRLKFTSVKFVSGGGLIMVTINARHTCYNIGNLA